MSRDASRARTPVMGDAGKIEQAEMKISACFVYTVVLDYVLTWIFLGDCRGYCRNQFRRMGFVLTQGVDPAFATFYRMNASCFFIDFHFAVRKQLSPDGKKFLHGFSDCSTLIRGYYFAFFRDRKHVAYTAYHVRCYRKLGSNHARPII